MTFIYKMILKLSMLFFVLVVLAPYVCAVRRVDVSELVATPSDGIYKRSTRSSHPPRPIEIPGENLEDRVNFQELDSFNTVHGNTRRRYRETYDGIKVYNTGVDVQVDPSGTTDITDADIFSDFSADLDGTEDCVLENSEAQALTLACLDLQDAEVFREEYDDWIFVDDNDTAHSALNVKLVVQYPNSRRLARPFAFIDKCTKEVLEAYDRGGFFKHSRGDVLTFGGRLSFARKYKRRGRKSSAGELANPICDVRDLGGNPRRIVHFGPKGHCLDVRRSPDGNMCFLENAYVKGVDLENTDETNKTEIASFRCITGYNDSVNGGFSPMLDAFYFATQSVLMYKDWYDYTPLADSIPYVKAHFLENYVNAYWDGESLLFGDGDGETFYPLTSMDTVAHELSHAITESASNLEYMGQSGGMNEAFSDMAGEAAEAYVFGETDWLSGRELYLEKGQALRYFDDPTKDGVSIKHVRNYTSNLDVHYSSGIYNHVFWLMGQTMGVRAAFECFLNANRLYWREKTKFERGACATLRGCYDAGYDIEPVAAQFRKVGITFKKCANFTNLISANLRRGVLQTGLKVSKTRQPVFRIKVPANCTDVTVTVSDGLEVDLSNSYDSDESPLASGTGSASTTVTSDEDSEETTVYTRVYRGLMAEDTEVTDAYISVSFS